MPSIAAERIELRGTRAAAFRLRTPEGTRDVELPLPGLYNVYNALGAAALCLSLGVALERRRRRPPRGDRGVRSRRDRSRSATPRLSILLVKNPAGANEILRTLALEPGELDLLAILNDRTADGRDVSWVWDADFEVLASRVRRVTCAGTRAAELALRFKYAGVPERASHRRSRRSPRRSTLQSPTRADGRLFVLPTYTALLELREELAARGHVAQFWQRQDRARR